VRIPLRKSLLKIRHERVRYIVIHNTWCQYSLNPAAKIDGPKLQVPLLNKEVLVKKEADINFHFILEQVGDEFYAYAYRPLNAYCEFPDINPDDNRAVHIALFGNYDLMVPTRRLYEVLAYRVVMPYMRLLGLSEKRIKLHSELSTKKEETCPGEFFDKNVLIAMIRKFLLK